MHPIATSGGDIPSEGARLGRRTTALVIVGLLLAAIGGGCGVLAWRSAALESARTSALDRLAEARSDLDALSDEADARVRSAAATSDDTRAAVAAAESGYISATDVDDLAASAVALERARESLVADGATPRPSAPDPVTARDTVSTLIDPLGAALQVVDLRREHSDTVADVVELGDRVSEVDEAIARTDASRSVLFDGLEDRAAELVAANPAATNRARISLTEAGRRYGATVVWPADSVQAIAGFVSAARELERSAAAEMAEAADPSFARKAEIEAYARSISFGVPLDITWQESVNGRGGADGWLSGTAEWYGAVDDSWADLTLSDSIADAWTDGADARALVTHEVGHAQVMRPVCRAVYGGPVFESDDEMWATAWAIGMGHDVPGSGESAYGRPADEQIAAAALCR